MAMNMSGHQQHLRWLRNQYALNAEQAEEEAQTRYQDYDGTIKQWQVAPEDIHPELATTDDMDARFKRYHHQP